MFILQYLTALMIPDEPERVQIQKSRITAISQKIVDKFEDEDYDKYVDYASDEEDEDRIDSSVSNRRHVDSSISNRLSIDLTESSLNLEPLSSVDTEKSGALKRANTGFYSPHAERKSSSWWKSMPASFWRENSSGSRKERTSLNFRKKKAYRTRVHHAVSNAIQLSPLAIFEYPSTENVENWHPPLSKDEFGKNSEMDILDLDI